MSGKRKRGFAAMTPEQRAEISARGGRAVQAKGTGHRFTPQGAAAAGRKGGHVVSRDRAHMGRIGRSGGEAPRARRKHGDESSR